MIFNFLCLLGLQDKGNWESTSFKSKFPWNQIWPKIHLWQLCCNAIITSLINKKEIYSALISNLTADIKDMVNSFGTLRNEKIDVPDRGRKKSTSGCHFLPLTDLTQQIRTAGVKTKAFRFIVWDKSVPSSETSNFRLPFMKSGTSDSLFQLTINCLRKTLRVSSVKFKSCQSLGLAFKRTLQSWLQIWHFQSIKDEFCFQN